MSESDVAAREGCLWVARPDMGTLILTGEDRLSWLQGVVSSDVERLANGEGSWGLVLTKQGKILADVAVVAGANETYLGMVRSAVERVSDWLSQFIVMEDVSVADVSQDYGWAMLHGPAAPAAALALLPDAGREAARASIDFTGYGGAAVVARRSVLDELEATLAGRGDIRVASAADWERLRVERLVPLTGVDMDEQRSPHEASLERRAVSWTKGCYLGQEAVCMQDMRGKVKRRLATVLLTSDALPSPGTPITIPGGAKVGETRTAAVSEVLGGPVAIALLSADASVPGTRVVVGEVPASVVELPFSPRAGQAIVGTQ